MSKALLLVVAIFLQNLNAISISKSKEFTLEHKPKFKQTSFEITIDHADQNVIEGKIQTISKNVKESGICTGGHYNISPNFRWEKNTKIDMGYTSEVLYDCEFVDKKHYEGLLDKVKKVDGIKLKQHEIRFIQTQEEKVQQTQELENMAFEFAKAYVQKLNRSFEACQIESIDLYSNNSIFRNQTNLVKLSKEKSESRSTITVPLDDTSKNSIKVNYKFTCN